MSLRLADRNKTNGGMTAKFAVGNNGGSVVTVALEIARERRELLLQLCEAVLNDRYSEAKILAKQLSGKQ